MVVKVTETDWLKNYPKEHPLSLAMQAYKDMAPAMVYKTMQYRVIKLLEAEYEPLELAVQIIEYLAFGLRHGMWLALGLPTTANVVWHGRIYDEVPQLLKKGE